MTQDQKSWPDRDSLFATAVGQEGFFTTHQAALAGYSPQLLVHYVKTGRAVRVHRGIYRLVHFPVGEQDDLVVAWLWSEQIGIISHQTALALHGLSDTLPAHIHLTLPCNWRKRRFRVPKGVVLHHADIPLEDRTWFGAVPITSPQRTLNDCARHGFSPELLQQAALQALRRGLATREGIGAVDEVLRAFGGINT